MSLILPFNNAQKHEINIFKQNNKVFIELTPELYNMLIIECKLTMYDYTDGRSAATTQEVIKSKQMIATLNTAPQAEEIPTL